jgi:hypothetical protein
MVQKNYDFYEGIVMQKWYWKKIPTFQYKEASYDFEIETFFASKILNAFLYIFAIKFELRA